ncbi:hypothetical protein EYF80_039138 [Liparis tanakae]|uniref:Uncharacterized protein n=1 Tax=Liparis tanakae TaxID=230148 RepID=A0A4Z2GAV7_9TELE|nr:hypothetical protein EYF80_039138 [Liparis tanakae]
MPCSHQRYAPTAERKTSLNPGSEPRGGPGKLPESGGSRVEEVKKPSVSPVWKRRGIGLKPLCPAQQLMC